MKSHSDVFNNVNTLLGFSPGDLDSGKTKTELMKEQPLNICSPFKWLALL